MGRRLFLALCAALMIAGLGIRPVYASDRIEITQAALESRDDGWYVNADFEFSLNPRLEEALSHGLPLYFKAEFDLTRSRWYWLDEKTVKAELNWRLSYHALTRQYRVSTGSLQLGFASLNEALGMMMRTRNWRILDKGALKPGETYQAAIRMQFDTSQLPKPFQISAITSREWTLESDWRRFSVTP